MQVFLVQSGFVRWWRHDKRWDVIIRIPVEQERYVELSACISDIGWNHAVELDPESVDNGWTLENWATVGRSNV